MIPVRFSPKSLTSVRDQRRGRSRTPRQHVCYNKKVSMRKSLRFLAIWIGCVVAVEVLAFALALLFLGIGRRVALSRSWREVQGTVLAVDRKNHLSVTVGYSVGSKMVVQTFQGSYRRVGDLVQVYCSPDDPSLSGIENPSSALRHEIRLFVLAGVMLGTFLGLAFGLHAINEAFTWPWFSLRPTPRLALLVVSFGVVDGIASSLVSDRNGARLWFAHGLVLSGTILLCARALRLAPEVSWSEFVKSRTSGIGMLLVVIGQIVRWY